MFGIQQHDEVCDNDLSVRERELGQYRCTCEFQTTIVAKDVVIVCIKSQGWVLGHLLHTLGGGWVELPGGKMSKDDIMYNSGSQAPDDYDYTDDIARRKGVRYRDDEEEAK